MNVPWLDCIKISHKDHKNTIQVYEYMPIDSMFRNEKKPINLMLFNEIDNFIDVYNNSHTVFWDLVLGRIDHFASSMIKFRPKNSVPKHCIRSITYNYCLFFSRFCGEVSLDLPLVLRQSSPTIPILMLYQDNPQMAHRLVQDFATRKQVKTIIVALSGAGVTEDRMAKRKILKAAQEVHIL